jgi:quinol-cytochrome oxidoreductase complex cytochrome b subunit
LLFAGLAAGLTGYGLTGDQRSFWGLTVAARALAEMPLLGPTLTRGLLGAETISGDSLPRLFALHAVAIPTLMALLAAAHIALVRIQGLNDGDEARAAPRAATTAEQRFFPEHAATLLGVVLTLVVLLNVLAAAYPPSLGPRADPLSTPELVRPEWYFYPASRLLALLPRSVAMTTLLAALGLMMGYPWLERWLRRWRRWREPNLWLGTIVVLALLGFTVWEAVRS